MDTTAPVSANADGNAPTSSVQGVGVGLSPHPIGMANQGFVPRGVPTPVHFDNGYVGRMARSRDPHVTQPEGTATLPIVSIP